jgi:hypothetical protein
MANNTFLAVAPENVKTLLVLSKIFQDMNLVLISISIGLGLLLIMTTLHFLLRPMRRYTLIDILSVTIKSNA